MDLKQTVQVDKDLQIRAYYAGHVSLVYLTSRIHYLLISCLYTPEKNYSSPISLIIFLEQSILFVTFVCHSLSPNIYFSSKVLGAAMFYAKVGDAAMVYTGDYNMTPDRHLGAAQIERLNLDLLISEYGISMSCILFDFAPYHLLNIGCPLLMNSEYNFF